MVTKTKYAIVCGTRPEILKIAPIIRELKKKNIDYKVYFTSQHFSYEMGKGFFDELNINPIKTYKKPFNTVNVIEWIKTNLKRDNINCVIVHGDTLSTLTGTLAAVSENIPIAHIEAGLRSFDYKEPFPEEYIRTMVDSVSTYLFCPTKDSAKNLPTKNKKIYITGNTIIDLLKSKKIKKHTEKQILVTSHRRENWDRIQDICSGIKTLSEKMPDYNFVFVRHANKKLGKKITKCFKNTDIKIIPPLPYDKFIKLVAMSSFIVTDSGGMIEEASYFDIPLAIIREKTERMEAIQSGHAILVGTKKDIWKPILKFFNKKKTQNLVCPFGNGNSAKKIVRILENENFNV